ncbi:MAG: CCA tRNA nucleotidyltransferase [Pelagibacterales bacterium]|nr:CCA tRNA nucleotidyltransferase [Pelagibacterales bacterium]
MNSILNYAKKEATPSKKLQEKKQRIAKKASDLVSQCIKKYAQVVGFELGGSYAKGTWLPEKADIDIFIKFNKKTSEKNFRSIGTEIGFQSLKKYRPYTRYAEHPFVEAVIEGTRVNIVPCYDVNKGEWQSATDRSIHHTKFMSQKLSDSLKEEVRILKKFFFHIDVYGAEIAKEGFSGYVSEVFISYFGSFEKTIKKISELKKGQVIGNTMKKFDSPIVIIDPVDNNRNLGTAISMDNLGRFVLASRAFLKKPSKKFFNKPISKRIMKNNDKIVVVQFRFKNRSDDIIWGQIKRASNALKTQLELGGFTVLRNSSVKDEKENAALIFLLHAKKIEKSLVRNGPEISSKEHCEKFISANLKKSQLIWINEEGKIQSLQKRKHSDVKLFLRDVLKGNLKNSGIPNGLENDFKRGVKIVDASRVSTKSIKEAIANIAITDETIFR